LQVLVRRWWSRPHSDRESEGLANAGLHLIEARGVFRARAWSEPNLDSRLNT
jgi:hypothetical protein